MIIRGYNIGADHFGQYVVWETEQPDGSFYYRLRNTKEAFTIEKWYPEGEFKSRDEAIKVCCDALINHGITGVRLVECAEVCYES